MVVGGGVVGGGVVGGGVVGVQPLRVADNMMLPSPTVILQVGDE